MKRFAVKRFAVWTGALIALMTASTAQAQYRGGGSGGVHVGLSALKYDTKGEGDNFNFKSERTHLDAKLGYLASSGLYIGGIYSTLSMSDGAGDRSAAGVTLGYHNDGWLLDLSYFVTSEYKTGGIKMVNGNGYGVDVGYNFMMSSSFYLGLQLSTKSIKYSKISNGAQDTDANNTFTEMAPMFNLGFIF